MRNLVLLFLLLTSYRNLEAQEVIFTDYQPIYEFFSQDYIIDKIEYTEENTIIHFRVLASSVSGEYTIYGVNEHSYAWYLEDENTEKEYDMLRVENVKVNDILAKTLIQFEEVEGFYMGIGDFMTCEVFFPRLPNDVEQVDLIEGRGQRNNQRHFNCLNIVLKPFDSPDLGTEANMLKRIQKFEKDNTGRVITTKIIPPNLDESGDIPLPPPEN